MSRPTGSLDERRIWYRTATDIDTAAALAEERSPSILRTVIGEALPQYPYTLLAIADLARKRRDYKYGKSIDSGITSLARNWSQRTDTAAIAAVASLVNSTNYPRGLRLFRDLWKVVNQPGSVDQFADHPQADVRQLALTSKHASETALLTGINIAIANDITTSASQQALRAIARSEAPGYSRAVATALLTLNQSEITKVVLQNPLTPSDLAAAVFLADPETGLRMMRYGAFPFLSKRDTATEQETRRTIADFFLTYQPDEDTHESHETLLRILHALLSPVSHADSVSMETTARLLYRWLPIAGHLNTGHPHIAIALLHIYKHAIHVAPIPGLPTITDFSAQIINTWIDNGYALQRATDITTLINDGFLPVEPAVRAAKLINGGEATPRMRTALIRRYDYPAPDIRDRILPTNGNDVDAVLVRLRGRTTDQPDQQACLFEDITILIPLLPRTDTVRNAFTYWMSDLAAQKNTDALTYLTTHPDHTIRRRIARALIGYKRPRDLREPRVTRETAEHICDTHRAFLLNMMTDSDPTVRVAVAKSPLLPLPDVDPLRNDRIAAVRRAARERYLTALTH